MKRQPKDTASLKKQLISGVVYVALAGVVVAVTINTTVGIISDRTVIPNVEEIKYDTSLPSIPEFDSFTFPEIDGITPATESEKDTEVLDIAEGVGSDVVEELPAGDSLTIPDEAELGFDKFINPCGGYVSKEFSLSIPVYSPTMGDYRTHSGVDIVGEIGIPVYVSNGGIVTEIYDDDLYGKTVCMQNREGFTIKYCNLMPDLYGTVEVGTILETGAQLGAIGETAMCECAEASHLHLEIIDAEGNHLDPEDYINF